MSSPRALSSAEVRLLSWAVLVAIETPLDPADLPIISNELREMLRDAPQPAEVSPLGHLLADLNDLARAFSARRRDAGVERQLKHSVRGYFLNRMERARQATVSAHGRR